MIMGSSFQGSDKPIPLIPHRDPRSERDFIYISGSNFYLHGEQFLFKGINYYPSKNSWQRMWMYWDPSAINTELALLESLGVNIIRIFLDYDLFEKNRAAGDESLMLSRLSELITICDSHGMKVLITPFVWGRGSISTDRQHIRHIVSYFKNDPRVFAWDISNELDHEWHSDYSKRNEIQEWAEAIFTEIKSIDENHLVTVGDYGWYLGERVDAYGSDLSLDLTKMSVSLDVQDFICFHWYEHYYALDVALGKLKEKTRKPIVIEEFGLPSGGINKNGIAWHLDEDQVAVYYIAWLNVAAERGVYVMPWCGFDYYPGLSPYAIDSIENYWGLYDINYRLKASGKVYRDFSLEGHYLLKMFYGLPSFQRIDRKDMDDVRRNRMDR